MTFKEGATKDISLAEGHIIMGTSHLMGLDRSPGTVIRLLSYLAHRYNRWNAGDRRFFARSGKVRQRQAGEKVGAVSQPATRCATPSPNRKDARSW
jgi:hypothetical protein